MKPYYQDEYVQIFHGDCREILPELPKVDLVLTDPPYGMTASAWDIVPDLPALWRDLERISNDDCTYGFCSSQPFTTDLITSKMEWFKYEWIWRKQIPTGAYLAKIRPMKAHENIVIFCKGNITYNPVKIRRTVAEFKDAYRYNDSMCIQGDSYGGGYSKLTRK